MFLLFKVFIFINLFYFKIILFFKVFHSYIYCQKEYKNIENNLKFSYNKKPKKIKKKINYPKISVISPLFNSERYISRFLRNIQFQNFNKIEILLIDDNSGDNSIKIIEEYQKEDERIILLKNRRNKGTFLSRNLGALFSKGKYIIIPDPDDIISSNILNICYKYAEKFNYEIIRFNRYIGNNRVIFNDIYKKNEKKPIYLPELSTYIFYENNQLKIIDVYITNKLIKKETFIRALNSLNQYYLNLYITFCEDTMMNFILYRVAKSFCFIKNIGYYHIMNSMSITNNLFKNTILRIKFSFIVIKLFFDYSKNTKIEKEMSQHFFSIIIKMFNIPQKLYNINKDFNFYINFIKIFLGCKFISKENKLILESYKNIFNKH